MISFSVLKNPFEVFESKCCKMFSDISGLRLYILRNNEVLSNKYNKFQYQRQIKFIQSASDVYTWIYSDILLIVSIIKR